MLRELSCLVKYSLHTTFDTRTAMLLKTRLLWDVTLLLSEQQRVIAQRHSFTPR